MSPDRPAVHMEILRADLGSCSGLAGAVVVIDVLRSFSTADLDYCAIADRFDFAMRVRWEEGRPALKPVA